jgi:hypothetical protein
MQLAHTRQRTESLEIEEHNFAPMAEDDLQGKSETKAVTLLVTAVNALRLQRSHEPFFEYACHEGNVGLKGMT